MLFTCYIKGAFSTESCIVLLLYDYSICSALSSKDTKLCFLNKITAIIRLFIV